MEDTMIVDLFLARDEAAIRHTAEKYGGRLRGLAQAVLNDRALAEECENDTYLEAWNRIPPHEPRTYLFAFLGRIARHIAIDRCRKQNAEKRSAAVCELTAELAECLPSGDNVESEWNARALAQAINDFLSRCPSARRDVFVRRYWYFDSVEQISRRYGFSQSKVKTTLFRMRNELKEELRREGFLE
ncbi:MAG: RNA polymerase sigma factor [Clostridia bacterium]|nr:RNA polymerase sigma factor [Clostridia bacterium]